MTKISEIENLGRYLIEVVRVNTRVLESVVSAKVSAKN